MDASEYEFIDLLILAKYPEKQNNNNTTITKYKTQMPFNHLNAISYPNTGVAKVSFCDINHLHISVILCRFAQVFVEIILFEDVHERKTTAQPPSYRINEWQS